MNFADQERLQEALVLATTFEATDVISPAAMTVRVLAKEYLKVCQEYASIEDQLQEYLLTSDPY
jgi:hypothetical protein